MPLGNYWACDLEPGSYKYWIPSALEPVLHNKRSHHNEKPATRENPRVQQQRPSTAKKNEMFSFFSKEVNTDIFLKGKHLCAL